MYLGIDDTDSRDGMCTTYVGLKIIETLNEMGYHLIGYPRLVRLNPNVPWKTRGNGSVVLRFGTGTGMRFKVGEHEGREIYAYPRLKRKPDIDPKKILETVVEGVEKYFCLGDETTNPGIVLSRKKLPEKLYWMGVREIITIDDVERILKSQEAVYKKYKNGRGIIGASCGISWRPKRRTYELLAYVPEGWKGERYVDKESVMRMDREIETTFDNYDYRNDYIAIVPHSKTPVLFGIRGTEPMDLLRAKDMLRTSPYSSYLIYETNQASDDHLVRKRIRDVRRFESVILRGEVIEKPKRIIGGHVIFRISDGTGEVDCAAYEPTKEFRDTVSLLIEGDIVEVYGGVRSEPLTVNIEKIRIIEAKPRRVKVSNPTCPKCGRRMESVGRDKGYRCRSCGIKLPEDAAKFVVEKRDIEGFYEVPVIARRHLSRPLKLMENI